MTATNAVINKIVKVTARVWFSSGIVGDGDGFSVNAGVVLIGVGFEVWVGTGVAVLVGFCVGVGVEFGVGEAVIVGEGVGDISPRYNVSFANQISS